MNNIKNVAKGNLPFLFLISCLILIHWHVGMSNDDLLFAKQSLSLDFFKQRYGGWSSRLITESILVMFMHMPFVFWKIINCIMICSCIKGLACLFWNDEKKLINNFLVILLCFLYPIQELNNAGWGATTINYLWPMVFCLPSFIADKKVIEKRKLGMKFQIFSIITLIIGTDVEFAWTFSFIMTVMTFLLVRKQKDVLLYYFCKFFILIAAFLKIILCPGNSIRFFSEVSSWFPDFLTLSIFDKIYLGTVSTASYLLSRSNLIFGVIVIIFLYLSIKNVKSHFFKGYVAMLLLLKIVSINAENQNNIWSVFHGGARITIMNATSLANYLSFILSGLVLIGVIVLILILYGRCRKTYYLLSWYLAGLGARMIMIFSPTLYASSFRTFLPLDISLIGIAIVLCKDIIFVKKKRNLETNHFTQA